MTEPLRRRQLYGPALATLAVFALAPVRANADVAGAVNTVRGQGCVGGARAATALRGNARLDEVAHQLSAGLSLRAAQERAGYHAASSFSVTISAVRATGDVSQIIARQFCAQVTNPAFSEIGVWRQGTQVWIALAEPFAPPRSAERAQVGARVLLLVNEARAHARRCGTQPFAAAAPLQRSAVLERAALAYAQDMARYAYMDHTGRDGSSPQQRISAAGYAWVEGGENLASGVMNADEVVDGWLHSPGHCANLMHPAYTEMGVGFAVNPKDAAGIYWALELGRPPGRP
jgi:uncharacterized protein YkwD